MQTYDLREMLKDNYAFPSKSKAIAFALRGALRILPLLANSVSSDQDPFPFWEKAQRADNLISIMLALNATMLQVLNDQEQDLVYEAESVQQAAIVAEKSEIDSKIISEASAVCRSVVSAALVASCFAKSTIAGTHFLHFTVDISDLNNIKSRQEESSDYSSYIKQLEAELISLNDDSLSAADFLGMPLWTVPFPHPLEGSVGKLLDQINSLEADFGLWIDWYQQIADGKPVDVEFMQRALTLPEEIKAQGAKAINVYMAALHDSSAVKPLNRVRAIFIGYGEAGKTSLIRVLHKETVRQGKEEMTPGIDIREWRIPKTEVRADLWDFGGQVMVHATHQLFLRSSCLYVLVISARAEINATEQAEYWLEHVRSFGADSPVIIVGNRIDQADLNIDMGLLRGKYPNIKGYFPLSCTQAKSAYKSHVKAFHESFCKELLALTTRQVMFTNEQFLVLKSLRGLTYKKSFLGKSEFDSLCMKCGMEKNSSKMKDWLLDVLDKLGVIIHFPQLPFADGYVLNPRWLTYGVYTLMYAKQSHLAIEDVIQILSNEKVVDEVGNELHYPPEKCRLIMDAMQEFKLSYPLNSDNKTIIIPALLPPEQPNFDFKKDTALAFEFSFDVFLPRHVLPELIVNRHREIYIQRVWQTGVWLKSNNLKAEALVLVDYHARKLLVWVSGVDAKDYLTVVRDDINAILRRVAVEYKEYIVLPIEARLGEVLSVRPVPQRAPYRQILASAARGYTEFTAESGEVYDISKVLQYFLTPAKQQSDTNQYFTFYGPVSKMESNTMNDKKIVVNRSTVHGAVTAADDILNSFNGSAELGGKSDLRALLQELHSRIQKLEAEASPELTSDVEEITSDAKILAKEVALESPNKSKIMRRLTGIVEAAKSIGEAGKSVVETASAISDFF